MAPSSRDRISVDLRGLRAALFEQARAQRVSPSTFVRDAVARSLGQHAAPINSATSPADPSPRQPRSRLSIRLTREDAEALMARANAAGLPLGQYIADLAAGVPLMSQGGNRQEHLAALVSSSAELATFSRSIRQLMVLLRQSQVAPAMAYVDMLKRLENDVRAHLILAASELAALRPQAPSRVRTDRAST